MKTLILFIAFFSLTAFAEGTDSKRPDDKTVESKPAEMQEDYLKNLKPDVVFVSKKTDFIEFNTSLHFHRGYRTLSLGINHSTYSQNHFLKAKHDHMRRHRWNRSLGPELRIANRENSIKAFQVFLISYMGAPIGHVGGFGLELGIGRGWGSGESATALMLGVNFLRFHAITASYRYHYSLGSDVRPQWMAGHQFGISYRFPVKERATTITETRKVE